MEIFIVYDAFIPSLATTYVDFTVKYLILKYDLQRGDMHKPSKLIVTSILVFSAITLAISLAAVAFIQDEKSKVVATDLVFPLANLSATIALFYAAKRSVLLSRRQSAAWCFLAFGQLLFTLGDVIWAVFEVVLHQSPYPSIADSFYLFYYPVFLIGILLLPAKRLDRTETIKSMLDMGIVIFASVLGFWNYLLGPLVAGGGEESNFLKALSLAYPVGDLVLLFGLLMLLYRKSEGQEQVPVLFLSASIAVTIASDCVYSYQSLLGTYVSGGWLDLGWAFSYVLIVIAGVKQAIAVELAAVHDPTSNPDQISRNGIDTWVTYLPYGWLVAAYLLLIQSQTQQMPMDFSWIAVVTGCIIGLVLLRQVFTLQENSRLVVQLHGVVTKVQLQALELSKTNQDLQLEIGERKRAEQQLAHDAVHDALTELPNRALFIERLRHAIGYGKRHNDFGFAVLFLDLDHFKVVNDSLGHAIGDQLLITIAHQLRMYLRTSDTVARLGGDEFVILLEDTVDPDDVTSSAQRIQEKLKQPFNLQGHHVCISASIGIVLNGRGYDRPEDILRDADIAMYQAKASGKARFEIFTENLRDRAMTRLQMENDLRQALENQEFELHYQPIIALQTDRIVGFEALLRWRHPKRGLVKPGEFIPIAEETGLIIPIGQWVLDQACRQIREWQTRFPTHPALTVNVNVSGAQLSDPGFVNGVKKVLQETGIEGRSLKLEITENVCLHSSEAVIEVFHEINQLGIQFEIDDFGTGYSSLSYLQNFPIQSIKIDRSFINQMDKKANNFEIIRTIIALAHDMGMDAIAEGIETRNQHEGLKKLGCNYGQGYLLSHPVDKEKAESLLEHGRKGTITAPAQIHTVKFDYAD